MDMERQLSVGLTERGIEAAIKNANPAGRIELVDNIESGLRLRISGDAAQWSVMAKGTSGQQVRLPLGSWPTTGVDQARKTAGALKRALVVEACDADGDLTVGNVLLRYRERRLSQLRKGVVMGRALETTLAPLAHRRLDEVTRREISSTIDDMADRAPIHANRVLAYAKAFFNWTVGRGYIESSPAAAITKPTRERARERTPTLVEVAEIWNAAGALGYPFGPVVRLLILTAARRDEVGGIRLDELELGEGACGTYWTTPSSRSKNGRAIRSPLSDLARQTVLEAQGARICGGNFLFSTTGRSAVSGWSRAKHRLDAILAGFRSERNREPFPAWRLHDLRRAFATAACDILHVDPVVVDRCLNHVGAGTTSTVSRIYARNELFDQRKDVLAQWAVLVEQAAQAVAPAEIGTASAKGREGACGRMKSR